MLHPSESNTDSMLLNADADYKTTRKFSRAIFECSIIMLWVTTSLVSFGLGYYIKAKECMDDGSLSEEL
jgi:hypothetical protein